MGTKKRFRVVTKGEYQKGKAKTLPLPSKKPKIGTGSRKQRITKAVTAQTRKR